MTPAAVLDLTQLAALLPPAELFTVLDAFTGRTVELSYTDDAGRHREHRGVLSVEGVEVSHDASEHGVELYVGTPNTTACVGFTLGPTVLHLARPYAPLLTVRDE